MSAETVRNILIDPNLFLNREANERLVSVFLELSENDRTRVHSRDGGGLLPGVYLACLHTRAELRRWAFSLISTHSPTEIDEFRDSLSAVQTSIELDRFAESEESGFPDSTFLFSRVPLWAGFAAILASLPSHCLSGVLAEFPSLGDLVVNALDADSTVFWEASRCLKSFLQNAPTDFWSGLSFPPKLVRENLMIPLVSWSSGAKSERIMKNCVDILPIYIESLEQFDLHSSEVRDLLAFLTTTPPTVASRPPPLVSFAMWRATLTVVTRALETGRARVVMECGVHWGAVAVDLACSGSDRSRLDPCIAHLDASLLAPLQPMATTVVRAVLQRDCRNLLKICVSASGEERELLEELAAEEHDQINSSDDEGHSGPVWSFSA
eukprot:255842_1